MISVLLTSIMVTSVMTVALTSKQGGAKADRKMIAAEGVRELQARLKNYIKDTTGTIPPGIVGPGDGANSWSLDTTTTNDTSCVNCNAIPTAASSIETHTITGILPAWFEAAPYNATLKYIVKTGANPNADPPRVEFAVDWTDP